MVENIHTYINVSLCFDWKWKILQGPQIGVGGSGNEEKYYIYKFSTLRKPIHFKDIQHIEPFKPKTRERN